MALNVEPVLQAQNTKIVSRELASQVAFGLVTKLGDPFVDDALVKCGVLIHASIVGVRHVSLPIRNGIN